MRSWIRLLWFMSSYSVLFVLLAIKEYVLQSPVWASTLIAVAVLSTVATLLILSRRLTPVSRSRPVSEVKDGQFNLLGYMASFILPFVAITGAALIDVIVLVAFFAVMGILVWSSRSLVPNPVLILFRFRWKSVTFADDPDAGDLLVPHGYPLDSRLSPAIPVGAGATRPQPSIEVAELAPGLWLAKAVSTRI